MTHRTVRVAFAAATAFGVGLTLASPAQAADPKPDLRSGPTLFAPNASAAQKQHRGSNRPASAQLRTAVKTAVSNGGIASIARADFGRKSTTAAAGLRQIDTRRKAQPQDKFRVASNTKMMVAALVMQQVQRGKWTLQTTVQSVLPGVLPGHGDITIEELLSHTSGMPEGLTEVLTARMTDPTSITELVQVLGERFTDREIVAASAAGEWTPRGQWSYSNGGYVLLGLMLEKATRTPLGKQLQRNIFKPAGMRQTTFATRPGLPGNALQEAGFYQGTTYSLKRFNPTVFSAAGAVVSTTKDLNAFTKALMTGKLVSPKIVNEMKKPRSATGYGLGLMAVGDPCNPQQVLYGHNGAAYGTFSLAVSSADGKRQTSVAVTGRYLDRAPDAQPYGPNALFIDALKAQCAT